MSESIQAVVDRDDLASHHKAAIRMKINARKRLDAALQASAAVNQLSGPTGTWKRFAGLYRAIWRRINETGTTLLNTTPIRKGTPVAKRLTDKQFELAFDAMSPDDKLSWLATKIEACVLRNGNIYGFNDPGDLDKMIEQEEYQRLTGRK